MPIKNYHGYVLWILAICIAIIAGLCLCTIALVLYLITDVCNFICECIHKLDDWTTDKLQALHRKAVPPTDEDLDEGDYDL